MKKSQEIEKMMAHFSEEAERHAKALQDIAKAIEQQSESFNEIAIIMKKYAESQDLTNDKVLVRNIILARAAGGVHSDSLCNIPKYCDEVLRSLSVRGF